MTDNFRELPQAPGGFFKPGDHKDAVALMFEVRSYEHQKPGNFGPKDTTVCDITSFASDEDLANGTPSAYLKSVACEAKYLSRDLKTLADMAPNADGVRGATIAKLGQSAPKAGQQPAWIFKPVSGDVKARVMAFYASRQAALAAAVADAPDF